MICWTKMGSPSSMAVRFKVWRRDADVWLRIEHPEKGLSVRLAYNEAERLQHKLGKVMERIIKKARLK